MSARKKRRIDTEPLTGECSREILSELDLEIALRHRVAETIESRITWALILQESLRKGGSGSTSSFKDAALDVVSTIEAPLDVIFDREIPPSPPVYVQPARPPRPPPKPKALRNLNAKFLYIRSSDLEPPYDENHVQTYLLRCPQCLRQTFTALQGLLNHARIAHGLEWGTHDQCVRACAVVDPELDIDLGIEVGLGPNGILPGLRSLFQMAVGVYQPGETQNGVEFESTWTGTQVETPPVTVTKTLGLHEDSPALATFLGKEAIRRCIKIWGDPDDFVDIEGFGGDAPKATAPSDEKKEFSDNFRHSWRMHFTHRNNFEPETEETMHELALCNPIDGNEKDSEVAQPEDDQNVVAVSHQSLWGTKGSRFHFRARVIVTDRSLWVPPDKRAASSSGCSHRWMISVDTPAYSHHITTILKRLTVYTLSDLQGPQLTINKPPFVVVGNANEPFLAQVVLHFSGVLGETTDQTVNLEHWVELDLFKSPAPVFGDEQVVDIELDKGTVLLPLQKGYPAISTKAQWSLTSESLLKDSRPVRRDINYTNILKKLAVKFPMTFNESKTSRPVLPPQVPYMLVTSSQFQSLLPGRRKAIEWSRARAIQDAYTRNFQKDDFRGQTLIPLTTADVYRWLSEEGHFIRPPGIIKPKEVNSNSSTLEAHLASPAVNAEITSSPAIPEPENDGTQADSSRIPFSCNVAPRMSRMPMVNVTSRLSMSIDSAASRLAPDDRMMDFRAVDLVAVSDPDLVSAVCDIVSALKLPTFSLPFRNAEFSYPVNRLGNNKAEVEMRLAPHAILALVAQLFVQKVVKGGVDVLQREKQVTLGVNRTVQHTAHKTAPMSVLMPSHILTSIVTNRDASRLQSRSLDIAIFECLARLGVPATPIIPSDQTAVQTKGEEVPVKLEEL